MPGIRGEGRPRIGGIVYTESARKVAYFVETAERLGTPLIYLQDVSGFMLGPEAERKGISSVQDVFVTSGVSETVDICLSALLNLILLVRNGRGP